MEKVKTPCEERGLKVGDIGYMWEDPEEDPVFSRGAKVSLEYDDGTEEPLFRLLEGTCVWDNVFDVFDDQECRVPGAYTYLDCFHKEGK